MSYMIKVRFSIRNEPFISEVVELGTKNSKTLGHFPRGAFIEHANKSLILIATEKNNLCGYLLFRIVQKNQSISITQLCVSENHRGKNVSNVLLDFLCKQFSTKLRGISLRCREDYHYASKLWESYGFKPKDKIRGRGKKETTLVKWWYDFGNPDLFSQLQLEDEKLKVVIDSNIVIKLRDIDTIEDQAIKSLDATWVYDHVDFFFAPEIFNEINRDQNRARAEKTRSFLRNFSEIRFKPEKRNGIEKELKDIIFGSTDNTKSDRLQLAECIASSFDYFITQDEPLLSKSDEIFEKFGLKIYRPTDLIISLDKLKNREDYSALRVEGSNYIKSLIEESQIEEVVNNFLKTSESERKVDFKKQLLFLIANVQDSFVRLIRDGQSYLGLMAYRVKRNSIEVNCVRTIKSHGLSCILFEQILVEIIREGLQKKSNLIVVTESYLTQTEKNTLIELGFIYSNDVWKKLLFKGITSLDDLKEKDLVRSSFNIPAIEKSIRTSSEIEKNEIIFELERKLWPAKIKDLEIPTYIIPIKPTWAQDLFDYKLASESMFGANASLIWSNENVYYRSVFPVSEKCPARILWYLSSGVNKYTKRKSGIIACSYLDEVHRGSAKELYNKFKNYGVYKWRTILELAKGDPEKEVKALKFSFTEVFDEIISKEKIDLIFKENDKPINTFNSPLSIKYSIFEHMYKTGVK